MNEDEIRDTWSRVRKRALEEMSPRRVFTAQAFPNLATLRADCSVNEVDIECEVLTFSLKTHADGSKTVICGDVVVEDIAPPRYDIWGDSDLYKLAHYLNHRKVGDKVRVPVEVLTRMSYNSMAYSDLWHALRGNLIGSSYGSFIKEGLGRDGGWLITRCEEGERIYDRDGYPERRSSTHEPPRAAPSGAVTKHGDEW
jgi:hypothetical protein